MVSRSLGYMLAAVLSLLCLATGAEATVQVRLLPTVSNGAVGSTITVAVQTDAVTDLGGFQFGFNYSATDLQAVGSTVNPAFDQIVVQDLGAGSGAGMIAATVFSQAPVSGTSVTLATIDFKILTPVSGAITLANVVLGQLGGTEIPSSAVGGSVEGGTVYTVTPNAGTGGGLSPSTAQAVNANATATFTATPATGYIIAGVTGCNGTLIGTTFVTGAITTPCTVNATFNLNSYLVTFASGGHGTLTGNASQTVNYGSSATQVTAVPATDYHFVNWTGTGGFAATAANPLAVGNVTATMAVTANFAADPVNGVCGSSNGDTFRTAPGTGLCAAGSGTAVSGSGPWTWSCGGLNGGSTANCSAGIDVTGPTLTVSTLADGAVTNNAILNVAGTVADTSGVATLTVNGAAVNVAGGGFSFPVTLQEGANTITITTTDTLGNVTNVVRTITLDTSAPVLVVSAPADNAKTAQPTVIVSGTTNETSTVTVAVNGGTPQSAAVDGSSYRATINLVVGLNSISLAATDLAGNATTAVRTITYDNSAPSLAIASPSQDVTLASNRLTVSGTVSDSLTTPTVTIAFDGQSYTPATAAGAFSQQLTIPAEGTYALTATATDEAGNTSQVIRNVIYAVPVNGTCGSSAGVAMYLAPTDNLCSAGTAGGVSGNGPWTWTCFGIKSGSDASCSSNLQSYAVTFTAGFGGTLSGNASQTVDSGASTTSVTAVPAAGYHFVSWTGTDGFLPTTTNPLTVGNVAAIQTFTANFAADPVNGICGGSNGGTFRTAPVTGLCAAGSGTALSGSGPWSWTCIGLSGGTTASCAAGIDVTGPTLVVSTLADGAITSNSTLNVSGTVADLSGVAAVTVNGSAVVVANGVFSSALILRAGSNMVTVVATDILGNVTTVARSITLDATAPVLTVSAPADNTKTAQSTATVSGTVNETSTVTVAVNGGTPQAAAVDGGSYSATVNLAVGLNSISLVATDLAGNATTVVRTITYLNSAPSLAIASPSQDVTIAQNILTISGTVSDSLTTATVTIICNGQCYTPALVNGAFSQQLTLPAGGSYPITATATDEAGNSSTVTRNVIYKVAVNGACGGSAGLASSSAPSSNLCSAGTAGSVAGSGPWSWNCSGTSGGSDASCASDLQSFAVSFVAGAGGMLSGNASQTVSYGSDASAVTAVALTGYHFVDWNEGATSVGTSAVLMPGNITGTHLFAANFSADPVNGACGNSNGSTLTAAPVTGLCGFGTASTVTGNGPWNWSCRGANGGNPATCAAGIARYQVSFVAGANGTLSGVVTQTVNYGGSATTVSAVPATDYHFVNWTASGNVPFSTGNPLTINAVTAEIAVVANFAKDLDLTPPVVDLFTLPASANGLTVPVTGLSASDNNGVAGYLLSVSPTQPALSDPNWSAAPPNSYTFATQGARTLYAFAKDAAGNISSALPATVDITLPDTVSPTVESFSLPATASDLTVTVLSLTASDNAGVTGYLLSESPSQPPANSAAWTSTPPGSFTFSTAGARTLYAFAKDAAGNVSAAYSSTVTVTLPDATPPTVAGFALPATSKSLTVPVLLSASDDTGVTGYLLSENSFQPQLSDPAWTATPSVSYTFSAGGDRTLFAFARDAAGNVSAAASATVIITLADATPPLVVGFSLAANSASLTVPVLSLTATDEVGVAGYLLSEDASIPATDSSEWTATAPASYTFAAQGAKTLYAFAKDAAGNISAAATATVTITLPDLTVPAVDSFSLPASSASLTVAVLSFTASDNVGVAGYLLSETAATPAAGDKAWTPTPSGSYTFATQGAKTLYAFAKDAAGNVSAAAMATVGITLPDLSAPTVDAFSLPAGSSSLTVSVLSFKASDNVGVAGYLLSETAAMPTAGDKAWTPTPSASYTFSSQGSKTLYAFAKDAAGNVSAPASGTVVVRLLFTVTASAGVGGSLSPATAQTVASGDSTSFTVTAASGYQVAAVSGCGGSLAGSIYTTAAIVADCQVSATFGISSYAVNFSAGANGSLSGTVTQTVSYGNASSAVTAVSASGYHFINWTDNKGVVVSTANPLVLAGMSAPQNLTANFAPTVYTITATTDGNGSITPSGAVSVAYGGSSNFIINAASGYYVSDVLVDGVSVGAVASYSFQNVTGNHAIQVRNAVPDGHLSGGGGDVSIADALIALQIAIGDIVPTADQLRHGDVAPLVDGKPSPNGVIDLGDVLVLLRRAVGLVSW